MTLWDKGTPLNKVVAAFTVGNDYLLDQRLVKYDCTASIAHAEMLGQIGVLQEKEVSALTALLQEIIRLNEKGEFEILPEHEDCHTAIELHVTQELGELGKKIHTARSRNDQVLTALRLYYKHELKNCTKLVEKLCTSLSGFTTKFGEIKLPGYTHTRKAMPSSIALWAGAFIDSMQDNLKLLETARALMDQSPLGTGAGYGVPLAVDRQYTADKLGFASVQSNPIYVQLSRGKFESTLLHGLSQIMFDLNRVASDIILFSLPELGYFELPDALCTGSSIMPQKTNPDVLELVRAKYHEVVAIELQLKTTLANLITGYHRDAQLTKEPTMRGLDVTQSCLNIMALVFDNLGVNPEKCERALTDEVYATERVYELVKNGMPFREAYRKIAKKYL